jgi:hypothetical protein
VRTITKTLYQFGELIEAHKQGTVKSEAVERARAWMIEGFGCFEWWDSTWETWKDALAQVGFTDAEMSFSGFASQGDGASFTCKSVDLDKLKAFMGTDIAPSEVIDGTPEDFRPWIVYKIEGKTPANSKYFILDERTSASVGRLDNRYSHENTCEMVVEWPELTSPALEKVLTAFEKDAEQLRRDICRAIYRDLEEEYEHQTSDEQLIVSAEANDYTFDATGRREG